MNELVLSTYIKIMRDELVKNAGQENAGRFLLESVSLQENSYCETDLDSKKISRIVSRINPVPDDIKQASLRPEIAENVYKYFTKLVLPDLNPHTQYDVLEKFCKVIEQDVQVSRIKKDELLELHKNGQYDKFLAATFLYVLSRNNKKSTENVEPQDAPFLDEVNFECPISHEKLLDYVKEVPIRRYVITQIFPDSLTEEERAEFEKISPAPSDYDASENLIALSMKASEEYLINPTIVEFKELLEIKKYVSEQYKAQKAINRLELEEDIRVAINALMNIEPSTDLPELEYSVLRVDEKIKNEALLKNEIQNQVLQYYRFIESAFNDSEADFDMIATEIKLSSQNLEKSGMSKEDVVSNLSEWIRSKARMGDKGKTACDIVVAFFIQNCEVFSSEISK